MRPAREVPSIAWMAAEERRGGRLRSFIRRRVGDADEAEDILQDVFYELVLAYRLMRPVEHLGAWLLHVARNRITDRFRKKKPEPLPRGPMGFAEDGEELSLDDLLPSPDGGPDAI